MTQEAVKISHLDAAGRKFIQDAEGLVLHVYDDGAGYPTAGYGHRVDGMAYGTPISMEQAEQWFTDDIDVYEQAVVRDIKVPLNQPQFNALVSFCYNLGAYILKNDTELSGYINSIFDGNFDANEIARIWCLYCHANGAFMQGLYNRRKAEAQVFCSSIGQGISVATPGQADEIATDEANVEILMDVPYVHQVYNTEDAFYGYEACGPSSCVMLAAAYGKLAPKPMTYLNNPTNFGYYVTNYSPAQLAEGLSNTNLDPKGKGPFGGAWGTCDQPSAGGGYEATVDGMVRYLLASGLTPHSQMYPSPDWVRNQLRQNKPVILSTWLTHYGHLIVAKGLDKNGNFICNDPYIFDNWKNQGIGKIYNWNDFAKAPPSNAPGVFYAIICDEALPDKNRQILDKPYNAPPVEPSPHIGEGLNNQLQHRFVEAYLRNGGEAALGKPTGPVANNGGYYSQELAGGSLGSPARIILDTRNDKLDAQPVQAFQPAFVSYGDWLRNYDSYTGSQYDHGAIMSDVFPNEQGVMQQNCENYYMRHYENNIVRSFPWPDPNSVNGWYAEYFNNTALAGKPASRRDEDKIGNDWSGWVADGGVSWKGPYDGKIGLLSTNFSARWRRKLTLDGNYTFSVTCDDGFRLSVNGQSLVQPDPNQFWVFSAAQTHQFGPINLSGPVTIVLEYFQAGERAVIKLDMQKIG